MRSIAGTPLPQDETFNWAVGSLLILLFPAIIANAEEWTVRSPDDSVACRIEIASDSSVTWSVEKNGRAVIAPSRLGFLLDGNDAIGPVERCVADESTNVDTTWRPVYGEQAVVRDAYHGRSLTFVDAKKRQWTLIVRAYDEGVAIRYVLGPKGWGEKAIRIASEQTQFRFADNHDCWAAYSAQGEYARVGVDDVKPNCERPLPVRVEDDLYTAIGEAALVDFARMRLQPDGTAEHALKAHLGGECVVTPGYKTPWRFVMLGDSPGQLLERNYLLRNLNAPCAIADTSWIKPGKVIREVTLSTEGGKACVDFAVARGFQYVEFDAGWYGHEYHDASDATTITVDPKRNSKPDPLDLHEVIAYAKERGIGVLVYVNRRALEKQLDEILPLYKSWGISGVKYGFVNVGSQEWTTWLHDAVRKAAEHELMVDIHDEYRPTGYERTYPNLMTQEGIRGNETMPTPELNCTLPFTRQLCGAGDYTPCWYSDRVKTTRAHQLACGVVYYSPWTFLHWYDRPSQYQGEPELDFWKIMPTVWDESRVPAGEIGEYIIVARRSGDDWFVGVLNAVEQRRIEIPLDFLPKGKTFTAKAHADAYPGGEDRKKVAIFDVKVNSTASITLDMAKNGGAAIHLTPVE